MESCDSLETFHLQRLNIFLSLTFSSRKNQSTKVMEPVMVRKVEHIMWRLCVYLDSEGASHIWILKIQRLKYFKRISF